MASRALSLPAVPRAPSLAFVAGAWTVYGVVHGIVWAASSEAPVAALRWSMPTALLVAWGWALLTPFVFRLTRGVAPPRVGWPASVAAHVTATSVCAVAVTQVRRFAFELFSPYSARPFLPSFLYWLDVWIFVYLTLVVVGHALDLRRRYVDRTVRAHLLEAQLARAQLQFLELQLQPHFLFNALNAIQELAHESAHAAERMLRRLHALLAISLDRSGHDEVTLDDELAALEPYLDIQRTRFSDWLDVDIRVPPQLQRALVPHLILQPLVENAIRHGLAVRQAPGRVTLSAEHAGDQLILRVQDDGVGLRHDRREGREGIGLRNASERLRQLYGAEHRFELRDAPSGGVLVELAIPYREGERLPDAGAVATAGEPEMCPPTMEEIASWQTGEYSSSSFVDAGSPPARVVEPPTPEWQRSGSFRVVRTMPLEHAQSPVDESVGTPPAVASPAVSLKAWLGIVVLWVALPVFWTNQMVLFNSSTDMRDQSILAIARLQVATSIIWLVLSPAVLWLARRFRIAGENWLARLPLHVVAALAAGFIHTGLMLVSGLTRAPVFSSNNLNPLTGDFFVYFGLLAWSHSRDFVAWYRTRELEAARLTSRIAGSRFQALRVQLRPQFLLATLELLAELVHRDVYRAERLITRLAETLRLTLDLGRESTTTIKQELDLLHACVEAHAIGIRPRVNLVHRVAGELLPVRIPSRLICTMIDDLLVADSANPPAPLTVRVEVERVHDSIRVSVRGESSWPHAGPEPHAWWRRQSVAEAAVADAGPLVSLTFPDRTTAVLMIADESQPQVPDEDVTALPAARSA